MKKKVTFYNLPYHRTEKRLTENSTIQKGGQNC